MCTSSRGNRLLKQVLPHCKRIRSSRRHPDYLRVPIRDYHEALLTWLEENARETIAMAQAELNLVELRFRLADKRQQAHQRMVDGVLAESR